MADNINIIVNETIDNIVVNPSITNEVIDVEVFATTEEVNIEVTPSLTIVNINSVTGGGLVTSVNGQIGDVEITIPTKTSDLTNDGEDGTHPFITLEDITIPTLQQILDNNHDLVAGNNFQGSNAGLGNLGNRVTALGETAGVDNLGDSVNALGESACSYNTGTFVNALGINAGGKNTGDSLNALGANAGYDNAGFSVNALGETAGFNNTGNNVNALGQQSGYLNEYDSVNLFGNTATADAPNQTVFTKFVGSVIKAARISYNLITENRKYELPNNSGTIALVSDIPIPTIPTLQEVTDEGNVTSNGIETGNIIATDIGAGDPVLTLNYDTNNSNTIALFEDTNTGFAHIINSEELTDVRTVTLPNKSGTIALNSDIPVVTGFVPYTGATQDVNLGEFGIQLGNLEFDLTPTNIPTSVGSLVWNDTSGTLDLKLKGGATTLQIGQETVARVVNKTATNITLLESKYQVVRVTGAQGQRPKVDLALANNDLNSTTTLGLVTENILNNQEGFITTSGQVQQINTTGSLQGETWADGDVLYLSGTVAGQATNIKPIAPIHTVILGFVEYAHITQGKIFVKVDNGYELEELHNVSAIAPNNNEVLTYDSATLLWKPKTVFQLPSLTSGSVLFSDGTTIAQDNANLFWDDTNNRLGIGTNTPTKKLDVSGDILVNAIIIGKGNNSLTQNTIFGTNTGISITTGNGNTFFGNQTGQQNNSGANNCFFGNQSGFGNTTGGSNTYIGSNSGFNNTTGSGNLFGGTNAGRFIANGITALTIANNSIFLGQTAKALADNQTNQIVIGFNTTGLGTNTTILGNSSTVLSAIYGNVLIGTTTDNGSKLNIQGSITAATAIARGQYLAPTLVASANNDVLVGLDIAPTFTNGAFTGLSNYATRVNGTTRLNGQVDFSNGWNFYTNGNANFNNGNLSNVTSVMCGNFSNNNLLLSSTHSTGKLLLGSNSQITAVTIFSTSNLLIQNGGTFTDNGFRLDVNGTQRVQGLSSLNSVVINNTVLNASAVLQADSTTKGFLPPRMTNAQRIAIATPAIGLCVYCTDATEGLYVNKSTGWTLLL